MPRAGQAPIQDLRRGGGGGGGAGSRAQILATTSTALFVYSTWFNTNTTKFNAKYVQLERMSTNCDRREWRRANSSIVSGTIGMSRRIYVPQK